MNRHYGAIAAAVVGVDMADTGLLPTGYVAPRGSDLLLQMQTGIQSELGVTIDWAADSALGALTSESANVIGVVSEGTQPLWDGFSRATAQGSQLDSIGGLIGVYRQAPTYSSATVTLSGTSGAIIPAGSQFQGGGADGSARWRLGTTTTLSGGSASVTVTAVDAGPVQASAGEIVIIATPVAGLASVTNPAAAIPGQAAESDASYRIRQVQELQQAGSRNANALRAALLALTESGVAFVASCVVLENSSDTATTYGSLSYPAHSYGPVIWPSTLTASQITAVALAIYDRSGQVGAYSAGPTTTDASGVATTVTGADGFPHPVRWYWAVPVAIPVAIALTLKAGYTLADVEAGVTAAVVEYFSLLAVGSTAYTLDIQVACAAVNPVAIKGCVVTLDGVTADYVPAITEIVQLTDGSPVVTA